MNHEKTRHGVARPAKEVWVRMTGIYDLVEIPDLEGPRPMCHAAVK
jgi:hypothetical protein